MKISVIIPTYNAASTLAQALDSVIAQDYPDVEIIIVDGGSTDGTLSIVEERRSHIAKVVSEPDQGVYDAMNKGILMSEGDVINILGADDYFYASHVLSTVARVFMEHPDIDVVYGDYVHEYGHTRKAFRNPEHLDKFTFFLRNSLCHQSVFVRRDAFDRVGLFDTSFKIAGDHDWNIRAFGEHKLAHIHIPEVVCVFRSGGLSSTIHSRREHALVRRRHFAWYYRGYWYIPDFMSRAWSRLRRLDFSMPIALRQFFFGQG